MKYIYTYLTYYICNVNHAYICGSTPTKSSPRRMDLCIYPAVCPIPCCRIKHYSKEKNYLLVKAENNKIYPTFYETPSRLLGKIPFPLAKCYPKN